MPSRTPAVQPSLLGGYERARLGRAGQFPLCFELVSVEGPAGRRIYDEHGETWLVRPWTLSPPNLDADMHTATLVIAASTAYNIGRVVGVILVIALIIAVMARLIRGRSR